MNLFRSAGRRNTSRRERIQASIEGYFSTLSSLVHSLNASGVPQTPQRLEEVNLANWIRTSTNLDFALTSLFLILEDAINTPPRPISERLIVAMEESLGDFADQCRILIRASEERLTSAARQTIRSRTPELEWLKKPSGCPFRICRQLDRYRRRSPDCQPLRPGATKPRGKRPSMQVSYDPSLHLSRNQPKQPLWAYDPTVQPPI